MATRIKPVRKTAFDKWWLESRKGLGPDLYHREDGTEDYSPYNIARVAFEAGRKSVPTPNALRKALSGLLDMLGDWDAGFDGFGEVNAAEKVLGRRKSRPK